MKEEEEEKSKKQSGSVVQVRVIGGQDKEELYTKRRSVPKGRRGFVSPKKEKKNFFFFLKLTAKFYDTQKDRGSRYCT